MLANSLGLDFTNLRPIVGNTLVNMSVLTSDAMVVVHHCHHCIRIPGVEYLLPTPMPNRFSIENKNLHYVPQEEDAAFDQEAPESEQVDEDELATDEEDVQPQEDIQEEVPYTTYADIYNLEGSINDKSNLAESLRDTPAYMNISFSKWSQGWAPHHPPPQ